MDEQKKPEQNQLPEAPASATVKIKSKDGFEWLFTIRDEKASVLSFKMKAMEKNWLEQGFTPLAQNARGGFPKKEPEYVPNRTCPNDGAKLVYANKRDGSKYIKCENNKWDKINNRATGCQFVEWPQPAQPRGISPVIGPDEVAKFNHYEKTNENWDY